MFSLSRSKEYFAFIQVEASAIASQLFRFNERAYESVLHQTSSQPGDFRTAVAAEPQLKSYLEQAQKIPGCRIILGFHSGMFSSIETVVTMRREEPKKIIDEAETENLISSALWKVLSRDRKDLAEKMDIAESAVTLFGALIKQVRVDAHRVASPVGFEAHTVEFTILYSAGPRALYDLLTPYLSGEFEIYLTELGISELLHLSSRKESPPHIFIRVSDLYTYIYGSAEGEFAYRDTITWGKRSLLAALKDELGVTEPQAVEILRRADEGLTSDLVKRKIEALLLEEVAVLLKGIGAHSSGGTYKMAYVSAPFSLPEALFSPAAARRSGIAVPVLPMPSDLHGEKAESGLTLDMSSSMSSLTSLCANAKAAQQFFAPNELNKVVKRRARWLVGSAAKPVS